MSACLSVGSSYVSEQAGRYNVGCVLNTASFTALQDGGRLIDRSLRYPSQRADADSSLAVKEEIVHRVRNHVCNARARCVELSTKSSLAY